MIKTFTNAQIYAFSNNLTSAFTEETRYLPAKVSYFIQKNRLKLLEYAEQIEQARTKIIKHYGKLDADGIRYNIQEDKVEEANNELMDLLSISQDIDISMINLSDLLALDFTLAQMEALSFMIEE